jgi:hypothetical protein
MKFGLLKSKIEHVLFESYVDKTLKKDLFVFEELILKDKNLSKLFYLYDELSSNLGLSESLANELIEKSIVIYENSINKISPTKFKELEMWVGHTKTDNNYENLDKLFSNNVTNLVEKISSKKNILESLKSKPLQFENIKQNSIGALIKETNNRIEEVISNLSESEKKEIKKIWNTEESVLKNQYEILKDISLSKLSKIYLEESESETKKTINETIEKIKSDEFTKTNFVKLKSLSESL